MSEEEVALAFKTRREVSFPDSIPVDFLVSLSPLDPQPYVLHLGKNPIRN